MLELHYCCFHNCFPYKFVSMVCHQSYPSYNILAHVETLVICEGHVDEQLGSHTYVSPYLLHGGSTWRFEMNRAKSQEGNNVLTSWDHLLW